MAGVLFIVIAAALAALFNSWTMFWTLSGFAFAIELFFAALSRLVSPAARPLTVGDIRGLDRIIAFTALGAVILAVVGVADRVIWSDRDTPLAVQIQSDYRSGTLTDDQYRLFAWSCEEKYGKNPVETKRSGQNTYVRCGAQWPGRLTLAAKTDQFDRAFASYWDNPNKPVTLTTKK